MYYMYMHVSAKLLGIVVVFPLQFSTMGPVVTSLWWPEIIIHVCMYVCMYVPRCTCGS